MGACCGGTVPPENKPNTESSAKFDTRTSTILKESDPQLQALIKQQQSQNTNIVQTDEDDEKKPLNTKNNETNDIDTSSTAKSIEKDISTSAINISNVSKRSKKKKHHKIPSESMDSEVITETQTMVIHENIGTYISVPTSISTNGSIASDSLAAQASIDHKLAILNEDIDSNNTFRKSSVSNDMFERKPSARQQISDAYLLSMNDIKTWSNNICKQLENNNLNHCINKCEQSNEECDCIKRLIFILKLYNQCVNDNTTDISIDKLMEYLSPYEDYQCINDYFHFSDHHQIQYKTINDMRNYFVEQCGDCNENKCVSFIRTHRDRYKKTTDQYYNCDDYYLISIQQIFDSIHCVIFHNIMYNNNKLSEKDNKQRKITIIRKRHCNLYTIDTGIQDIKTDEEIQYELEQKIQQQIEQENKMPELNETAPSINSMASQLIKKLQQQASTPSVTPKNKLRSKNMSKLVSPKIPSQRPNSIFEGDIKDPNYIASEREYLYLPYAFGQYMFYDYDYEFQLPKYSDLKKELVLNTTAPLNEYQWNIEDKKAKILKNTYKIPVDMSLDQIVSVLVYCNYNILRKELQKSFAEKTKHKSYFHWSQLLFSVIRQFGVINQQLKTFPNVYCALNYPYKFYSFTHFNFTGLFSTSNNETIVEYSNTFRDGMILKLNHAPFWQAQFMDLSIIYSDFKDEQQQLFGCLNGCVLKIDEIFTFHDIRENTLSFRHKNRKFISALQLFEQIVIDISYIDDNEQYKWLNNSIENGEEKNNDFDDNEYTIIQILESMIYECLLEDICNDRRLSVIKQYIEIPTFIKTQFGYFGHYYRETEFCKLCFDTKKIEMLPREIQKYFMNDKIIAFGNWCKLFPNDRIICIKNVEINKYESFINLFATFVNEMGAYINGLQCVDINTNSNIFDENINDMINKKNESKFKYANWTLSYEVMVNENNEIENQQTQNNYSILISKNAVDDIEAKQNDNIHNKIESVIEEPVNDEQNIEVQNVVDIKQEHVEEIVDNIEEKEMDENENEIGNILVVESSEENNYNIDNNRNEIGDRSSINNEEENEIEEMNDINANKENTEPIIVEKEKEKEKDNISSPSAPVLDGDIVSELQSHVSILVDEHKQTSKDTTPQSTDTWGTSSPQPFANRWDNASTNEDNTTPISIGGDDIIKAKNKKDNLPLSINIPLEDKIWNSYIEKWGYEPKTPSQLQLFSKNPEFEKHLSFKNAKLHFNKRKGKGKVMQ